ncbi:nickel/cobalt transporter [Aquabacter spiritensis]|uniref:Nickel/cobalt efflux system n=1 Tax=Aquabacter spiritensis TaxID=933073 RepID=A0A4R3M586_9HYPH|nr:nickel/cobalt transporter [Aquabacter spiritensis]TCT07743.1 ABC-type nickel/cobalt efflux system permease component RcnA [Aquabacter spiritensis]
MRPSGLRRPLLVLLLAVCAGAALDAGLGHALAQALGGGAKPTPFGLGATAGGAGPGGITGFLIAKQSEFYRALIQAVRAAKADGNAFGLLAGLSFAYGVFHAAGPGHGKAVISAYLLADGGTLRRGIGLAFAAAMVQALAAILFVGILALALGATAPVMARAMNWVEIAAYGGIAAFGAWLALQKGRVLIAVARGRPVPGGHVHGPDCGCIDKHAPDPHLLDGAGGLRRAAVAVISAGARPCSGAILVLIFALSQGVLWSGVAATLAMGVGTALTVSAIAILAVYGKQLAVRLAAKGSGRAALLMLGVEVLAALAVMAFGLALLTGYLASERLLPG